MPVPLACATESVHMVTNVSRSLPVVARQFVLYLQLLDDRPIAVASSMQQLSAFAQAAHDVPPALPPEPVPLLPPDDVPLLPPEPVPLLPPDDVPLLPPDDVPPPSSQSGIASRQATKSLHATLMQD